MKLFDTYEFNIDIVFGPMISALSVCQYILSKTAHMIFLKPLIMLQCLKRVKNWGSWFFAEKSHFGDNAQKHTQNSVFWILHKRNGSLICRCFRFKSCTISTFVILLKLHVCGNSGSGEKFKNALGQSYCRIFKL